MNALNSKRIAKNAVILYLRMILILGLSLYTSRVVLIALGVIDFGIYNAVAGFAAIFIFFNSGLINASQRFISFELGRENAEETRNIFNLILLLHVILCLILLVLFETAGLWIVNNKLVIPEGRMFAANCIYQFAVITSVLAILKIPFNSCIIAEEKMNVYAYLGIFDASAKLLIILLLSISSGDKLILYGLMMLSMQIVVNLVYVIYCRKQFAECRLKYYWSSEKVKELFSFISYTVYGCFSWSVAFQGSDLLLNMFFGPALNAARGIAFQVSGSLNNFLSGIFVAVKPQMIKSYALGEIEYLKHLFILSSKYSILLFVLLAFPLVYNIDYILSVWLKEVPEYTNSFTCLIIVDSLILTQLQAVEIVINATGNVKNLQIYGRTITLLTLPVMFVIYKFNLVASPNAVFAALILGELGYWIYGFCDMLKKVDIGSVEYLRRVILRSSVLIAMLFVFNIVLKNYLVSHDFISFVESVVLNIFAVGVLGSLFFVEQGERGLAAKYIKEKIKK